MAAVCIGKENATDIAHLRKLIHQLCYSFTSFLYNIYYLNKLTFARRLASPCLRHDFFCPAKIEHNHVTDSVRACTKSTWPLYLVCIILFIPILHPIVRYAISPRMRYTLSFSPSSILGKGPCGEISHLESKDRR